MKKSDFSFDLPEELIAQSPLKERDQSRLMRLDKKTGQVIHSMFADLPGILRPGDCLVLNDSRVIPARLLGNRVSGGAVEVVLLRDIGENTWECLTRPGKKTKIGAELEFGGGELKAVVAEEGEDGKRLLKFSCEGIFLEALERLGKMPLPPYIHEELEDSERYQTVYSKVSGSAAAPTAGLHFTNEMLETIAASGVHVCFLTLHVGLGTFRPVKADDIEEHKMHAEFLVLSEETANTINEAKAKGGRVIAVGTTSCRALESCAHGVVTADENSAQGESSAQDENPAQSETPAQSENPAQNTIPANPKPGTGALSAFSGFTDIFIYPGFEFKCIDGLITNFHLPESTLIMLVSAMAGRENILAAYEEAVRKRYRFFSFGDAMLIS